MHDETPYSKVFQTEVDAVLEGLEKYPGEIFPELVFRVVRELESTFVQALEQHHVFDPVELGKSFSRAGKFLVHEKDIAFCILSVLPPPKKFTEDAQFTLGQVIDKVEQAYGGAMERLDKKWRWEMRCEDEEKGS